MPETITPTDPVEGEVTSPQEEAHTDTPFEGNKIEYELDVDTGGETPSSTFMAEKASKGALCAIVTDSYSDSDINNINNSNFLGTGICRYEYPNKYHVTIEGEDYVFDSSGNPISENAQGKAIKTVGKVKNAEAGSGSAVSTTYSTVVNKDENGNVTTTYDYNTGGKVFIDELNARDQFAVQAMRGILANIKDADKLSTNEISYYCNLAYKWAGSMMSVAANARGSISDETASSSTSTTEIGSLEGNTEKLLNNIVAAIDKKSKLFADYIKHTPESAQDTKRTVGLEDLIAAISNISGGFPTRDSLGASFVAYDNSDSTRVIHDVLTFNSLGAVGYSTISELCSAVILALDTTSKAALFAALESLIDNRIKAWLNATTIVADGSGWKLNVPNNL